MIWVLIFISFFAHSECTLVSSILNLIVGIVDPLSPFPTFSSSGVNFLLWTRNNDGDFNYEILKYNDVENLKKSSFDGTKKTFFHFHGFTNNGTMEWILLSKTNILNVVDGNIISVDYGKLVPPPDTNYPNSVFIMYSVAKYTGQFVDWLIKETKLSVSDLHLIGHSLGAHAAGMTATFIKSGTVERITGLDPAGPEFEAFPSIIRLDKSQAKFVDIMHTNGCVGSPTACRGIIQKIGHIDFYVNGGLFQPGCPIDIINEVECSHQRVTDLWNESINPSTNKFTSYPCGNYNQYLEHCGECGPGCVDMGFYLNKSSRGVYYLKTNSASPYAIGQ